MQMATPRVGPFGTFPPADRLAPPACDPHEIPTEAERPPMLPRILSSATDAEDEVPRLPWPVATFTLLTMMGALAVALTASDLFTVVTMAAGVLACIAVWQTVRDPLVIVCLTTLVLGAVMGWGLAFYDRIWWYDDLIHFLFSFVGVMGVARVALHRFRAESPALLLGALWLSWLGIGALWEIAEWTSDQLQSTHHSRGYTDTMMDMILNSAGSALGAWLYWARLRTPADRATVAA